MMNAADQAIQNGKKNRAAVWNFFQKNPCHTQGDCAKALGLSAKTVVGHCRAIREGWRPTTKAKCDVCGVGHG